jgi:hypothetical protein
MTEYSPAEMGARELTERFKLPTVMTPELAGLLAFMDAAQPWLDLLPGGRVSCSLQQSAWALYQEHFVKVDDQVVQFREDHAELGRATPLFEADRTHRVTHGVMYMEGKPVIPERSYEYARPEYPDNVLADLKAKIRA